MMQHSFNCKSCGHIINIADDHGSRFITCEKCGIVNSIPSDMLIHETESHNLRKNNGSPHYPKTSESDKKRIYKKFYPIVSYLMGFIVFFMYLNIRMNEATPLFLDQYPVFSRIVDIVLDIGLVLPGIGFMCILFYLYTKCSRPGKLFDPMSIFYYHDPKIKELIPFSIAASLIAIIEFAIYMF